jgi:citrate lyase subunit beta/citryl-CoA lyase
MHADGLAPENSNAMSRRRPTPRCWLFAPGDSPHKIEKAFSSGADAVILDLEDSVSLNGKADARRAVAEALAQFAQAETQAWVRINALDSGLAQDDLNAVVAGRPVGIVLPKSVSVADVTTLGAELTRREMELGFEVGAILILAITTETPASLFNLQTYSQDTGRLCGLTWGAEDLSAAIGASSARDETGAYTPLYELARSLCLAGSAAAGVAPIETVYPNFRDLDGLAHYLAKARRDGFVGMMAIHPGQVSAIMAAFVPTLQEQTWARQVVDLFAASPGAGALSLKGQMVDLPHLLQAQHILKQTS